MSIKTNQSITVADLKRILEDYDDDQEVLIAYTANDYWKTEIAAAVDQNDPIRIGQVKYSEYHRCDKIAEEDSEDTREVILINLKNAY